MTRVVVFGEMLVDQFESGPVSRKEIMASRPPFPGGCSRPDCPHVVPSCHACLFG